VVRASNPNACSHFTARIAAGHHRSALLCLKVSDIAFPNRAV
jgi:hypothetical protein